MITIFLAHGLTSAVIEPLALLLLRLAGGPARLPRRNEDFVWY
jgi:hypothetical protein